jgi:hypothetical protein
LIVILREDHELLRRYVAGGIAMPPPAIRRVVAGIHKALAKRLGQMFKLPKILIIATPIAGEQDVQGMVKIVIPLGIEAIAPELTWSDDAGIVQRTLGDDVNPPIQVLGARVQRQAEFLEKRLRGVVQDGVDGVESQGVDVELGDPEEGIVDEKTTHFIAVRAIEVERASPRGLVALGKVGAVVREIVSVWSEMVIDDVEDHRQTVPMAGLHQPF